MVRILKRRWLHFCGLSLFALQLADASTLVADATTSHYLVCPHLKVKFLRGNPCPCGHHHGLNRNTPRFMGEHGECESDMDSNRLRAPGFEAFVFTFNVERLWVAPQKTRTAHSVFIFPLGVSLDPPESPS